MDAKAHSLDALRAQARRCRDCPLWKNATQTVFGEGSERARIMLVGEQPGDKEDLAGHPFVGPAGAMLDRALAEAGIARDKVYVTNAVKHFKWEPRGKRRMHKTPAQKEIAACHQWLEGELAGLKPKLAIALGATAAYALLGHRTPVGASRGRDFHTGDGTRVRITMHPSFLLRMPAESREPAYARFVEDLRLAAESLQHKGARSTA